METFLEYMQNFLLRLKTIYYIAKSWLFVALAKRRALPSYARDHGVGWFWLLQKNEKAALKAIFTDLVSPIKTF